MIAIFGASVTQQKTGYASNLRLQLDEEVLIYGFGGMHLNNAGICYIDKVLESKPSHCFIDWFSTAYTKMGEKTIQYIDTIIHKFSSENCKLIFLFFPSLDYLERKEFHFFCKKYLEKVGAYYIDVASNVDDLDETLRDNVHTTDYGSKKYSDTILSQFLLDKKSIVVLNNTKHTKFSDTN